MAQLNAHANVTAPTLGATLASITVPPGSYEVTASVWLSGTVGAGELDNVALQNDPVTSGTFVTSMVLPVVNFTATVAFTPAPSHAEVDAQSTIKLIAVAAGGASAIYHVTLVANPIAGPASSGGSTEGFSESVTPTL